MKIFVSYRSTDRSLVNQLVTDLGDLDHELWYDQELEGGQNWWDQILEKVRWCDVLVFAMTPRSLESVPCQREYTYANELKKHILPIQITRNIDVSLLPVILQERQIIDYSERDANSVIKLSKAINGLPLPPPLPQKLPKAPDVPISPLAPLKEMIDQSSLTREQQAIIVTQLKTLTYSDEHNSGARQLLERLKGHTDLLAGTLRDINDILDNPTRTNEQLESISMRMEKPNLDEDDQVALVNQLQGYLDTVDYDARARELLVELRKHDSLTVAVYKEIQNALEGKNFSANLQKNKTSDDIESKLNSLLKMQPISTSKAILNSSDNEITLYELDITSISCITIGLVVALFTGGIGLLVYPVVRLLTKQTLVLTNKKMVFSGNIVSRETITIPYDTIVEIKKIWHNGDPSIEVTLNSEEKYVFTILAAYGLFSGNRQKMINTTKEYIPKYKEKR